MKTLSFIFIFSSFFLAQLRDTPLSLANTTWNSSYYIYANFYSFQTGSKGYKLSGQLASSLPVDTLELAVSGKSYLYTDTLYFDYYLRDSFLIINYPITPFADTFTYDSKNEYWWSSHEYVYGKEVLIKGNLILTAEY